MGTGSASMEMLLASMGCSASSPADVGYASEYCFCFLEYWESCEYCKSRKSASPESPPGPVNHVSAASPIIPASLGVLEAWECWKSCMFCRSCVSYKSCKSLGGCCNKSCEPWQLRKASKMPLKRLQTPPGPPQDRTQRAQGAPKALQEPPRAQGASKSAPEEVLETPSRLQELSRGAFQASNCCPAPSSLWPASGLGGMREALTIAVWRS